MDNSTESSVFDRTGLYIASIDEVIRLYKKSLNFNEKHLKLIQDAWEFCVFHHKNQLRADNVTPYYFHPLTVAYYIASWGFGYKTIIAALFHDLVEDVNVDINEIEKKFGSTVAFLVKTVTKINVYPEELKNKAIDVEDVNLYKIILGMAQDFRVIVIKLADRLHNMQTIQFLSRQKQERIAKNTLEIYVPIAVRIGLQKTADTLKDLIFKVLNPVEYNKVKELVAQTLETRKKNIENLIDIFKKLLDQNKIKYLDIFGRPKTFYSIYCKMQSKYHNFNNIYDLDALRIITYTKQDCYLILGAIHEKYIPIFSRFKDFVASPKPNMYQSLHTSIMIDKNIIEVQIRTKEMDEIAEYGIAAHWLYKEGDDGKAKDSIKLSFFKKYIDFSFLDEMEVEDVIKLIKTEVLKSFIYAITPKGDTFTFPKGATVLDFAYRIHSKIGDTAMGGYVNGSYCPLNYQLKTGDIVEIKTSPHVKPVEEWLKKVKTSSAISKIKKTLNLIKVSENEFLTNKGKKKILAYLHKNPEVEKAFNDKKLFNQKLHLSHIGTLDKFYYAVGVGSVNHIAFFNELVSDYKKFQAPSSDIKDILNPRIKSADKPEVKKEVENKSFFDFKNIDNLKYSIAKCCLPIPFDEIIGVISAKHGVAIHHKDCHNISELIKEDNKIIQINWDKTNVIGKKFPTKIKIECLDRANLLNDIVVILSKSKINIENIFGKKYLKNVFVIKLTLNLSNNAEFEDIKSRLMSKIKDIYTITRIVN
ncbi:RelA/SpoT family protein [Mycoplasma sp. SG1]|uniref:RelA/SpoT family protein n=1 Tax=Mycoplasma sp. SG1 TaxID=2810348 RepID=UPI002024B5B5|nr:RelA/SpoT family protein [Mycoplasma sp. SG1]URM53064.1 RelA/SpoT family protein [Mycoplasma sp. SG1]